MTAGAMPLESVGGHGAGRLPLGPARLLSGHEGWLRTVVASRLREPQAVEDVLQEVALAAAGGAEAPADSSRWRPWLYRIAVRQSLLYRRRAGRERRRVDRYAAREASREAPPGAAGSSYDPLALVLRDERDEMVRRAIRRLRTKDAEILLLKYTEDWSYRELAERLGIGEGAVEARLHRARARLRAELSALESDAR